MERCLGETCVSVAAGSPATIFAQLIQTLIAAQCSLISENVYPADRTEDFLKENLEFDFIVAGAGTAGSIVASRLSEVPEWRVLLIERGDDPSLMSSVPGFVFDLQNSNEDYAYLVEPNKRYCQGMKNRQCVWSKGKALGGSSVINAMIYIRGNDRDFNKWAASVGEEWNYKNVLPYFLKAENHHPDAASKQGNQLFGTGGPLSIGKFNAASSDFQDSLKGAAEKKGYEIIGPGNPEKYVGFGAFYGTVSNGVRQSISKAYLSPIRDRKNLYVIKSARVNSVAFKGKVATGVEVTLKDGRNISLKSSKEVIVSAGSIASPQILMLSGIGPRKELQFHKIDLVADLPVGKNLQDHIIWPGIVFSFQNRRKPKLLSSASILDYAYEYLTSRTGEFAAIGGIEFMAFFDTKKFASKYPNIQMYFLHIKQNDLLKIDSFAKALKFSDKTVQDFKELNKKADILIATPCLLNPLSSGSLALRSSNPEDQIKIYANYFHEKEDVNILLESKDLIISLFNSTAFNDIGENLKLHRMLIPDCEKYSMKSNDYWTCNLRQLATTVYHQVGTCKMGTNFHDSVVDKHLKVHNVKGLRVIDASIMPNITSANTNAPVIMIGEKGSDLIKKSWLKKVEL